MATASFSAEARETKEDTRSEGFFSSILTKIKKVVYPDKPTKHFLQSDLVSSPYFKETFKHSIYTDEWSPSWYRKAYWPKDKNLIKEYPYPLIKKISGSNIAPTTEPCAIDENEWKQFGLPGIWRSTDNGLTWKKYKTGIDKFWIAGLSIERSSCNTLYSSTLGSGLWKIKLPDCPE